MDLVILIGKDLIEHEISENALLDRSAKIITEDVTITLQGKSEVKSKPIISEEVDQKE